MEKILELIDANSFKDAEKKIGNALKATPDNPAIGALQAYLLAKQGKLNAAKLQMQKAVEKPITQLVQLEYISLVYTYLREPARLLDLYDGLAKKNPNSKELLRSWFSAMIAVNSEKGLQKAALMLQKTSSSDEPIHTFWAMFTMVLASESTSVTASEKQLFPLLAYRLLATVTENINNPQHAYVKARVLLLANKHDELIAFLTSPKVLEWGLLELNLMHFQVLCQTEKWESLYELSLSRLKGAQESTDIDNWIYWKHGIDAAVKLGKNEELLNYARAFRVAGKPSRNALLAAIKLGAPVSEYLEKFSTRRCVVDDLQGFDVSSKDFAPPSLEAEISFDEMNRSVNYETLSYLNSKQADVKKCVSNYLRFSPLLKTKDVKDYHSADDFLIIASQYLVENGEFEKAVILLTLAANNDKHQFYLRLWLIHLYTQLGAPRAARVHYNALTIKELQKESLSYLISTRLSTLNPSVETIKEIRHRDRVDPNALIATSYRREIYTQVDGLTDLKKRLDLSLSLGLEDIEYIRSARLTKPSEKQLPTILPFDQYYDNRDYSTLKECKLNAGPKQSEKWLKVYQLRELVLKDSNLGEKLVEAMNAARDELTSAELWDCQTILARARGDMRALAKSLKEFSLPKQYDWEWVHTAYTGLEVSMIIAKGGSVDKETIALTKAIVKTVHEAAAVQKDTSINIADIVTWAGEVGVSEAHASQVLSDLKHSINLTLTHLRSIK